MKSHSLIIFKLLFVNLVRYCNDKKEFDETDVDERITYKLTPVQSRYACKIRSICNNFHLNTEKIISKYELEIIKIKKPKGKA